MARLTCLLVVAVIALGARPAAGQSDGDRYAGRTVQTQPRVVVLPLTFVSQLAEPPPAWWSGPGTPYCVAAASAMVLRATGIATPEPALATLFGEGHGANVTSDAGVDPQGAVALLRGHGVMTEVVAVDTQREAVEAIVASIDRGVPAIVLTMNGTHAVVAYGYALAPDGELVAVWAADPLTGDAGQVPASEWLLSPDWLGSLFSAPGSQWWRHYVLVGAAAVRARWWEAATIVE